MYRNLALKSLGNFKGNNYLSSSENNANTAWIQNFSDGEQATRWDNNNNKSISYLVRAIRQF
ncbi:hypothetical protein LQZ19_05370 [Treponema primitia]|uniref:hypothetical protein n=1 Tax=Treponema primitia TaxID=88058 RepID=UPI00397F25F2